MCHRSLTGITLGAAAALAVAGATALLAGPAVAAGACLLGLLTIVGAGLALASTARRAGQEAAAEVTGLRESAEAHTRFTARVKAYLTSYVQGTVPERVTERFEGDPGACASLMNAFLDQVEARNAGLKQLIAAGAQGNLGERFDASRFRGYSGQIIVSVGELLESVQRPVREATETLERLARRDLTARMTGAYAGEFARLKDALNATAEGLHDAVAQVATSTHQVSGAASQIAASSQDVAAGASEQASSLEETNSQLEAMTSMVKASSDNAQQASALAQSARAMAGAGADAMAEMAGAMEKIRASAEGTSQIIKDINEIAFQTNLLALNAAVEAARAGAAGRGFAVVAEEVRSLALRSKEAANKTEALIRESVKQTGEGDATARAVADKLGEINTVVGKVTDIVAEIAASAREQSSGIDQVTSAVAEMNKVTQQNAASSEQSSSAAVELSSQSEELASLVGSFRLAGEARAVTAAPMKPSRAAPRAVAPAASLKKSVAHARNGAGKKGVNGKAGGSGIALKPEDLIPLEGDGALEEF